MTQFEIILTILNVVAVALSPIIAVIVGQRLQDRAAKRKDKMDIFMTLMVNRYSNWSYDSVRALNCIDIIFSDNKEIRSRWKEYYDKLCIQNPSDVDQVRIRVARDRLLEAMACSLGYKDKVTWETIQNPYVPAGMFELMAQGQIIQAGQVELAKVAGQLAQLMNAATTTPQNQQQEEQPHVDT